MAVFCAAAESGESCVTEKEKEKRTAVKLKTVRHMDVGQPTKYNGRPKAVIRLTSAGLMHFLGQCFQKLALGYRHTDAPGNIRLSHRVADGGDLHSP